MLLNFFSLLCQYRNIYEEGQCSEKFDLSSTKIIDRQVLSLRIYKNMEGYFKSLYTSNHLQDFESMKQFKDTFEKPRYYCTDTQFNEYPYYLDPGWGNGYKLPLDDQSEEWDGASEADDHSSDVDYKRGSWKSDWTADRLQKWEHKGPANMFFWTYSCRDGNR